MKLNPEIYVEAAKLVHATYRCQWADSGFICLAIKSSCAALIKEWNADIHLDYTYSFAEYFKPESCEIDSPWFGSRWDKDCLKHRVIAALLMSEIAKDL